MFPKMFNSVLKRYSNKSDYKTANLRKGERLCQGLDFIRPMVEISLGQLLHYQSALKRQLIK